MLKQKQTNELIENLSALEAPVLSVYADINPANPDNKGGGWRTRVKNALKDIPDIHKRTEHRGSLYDAVLELLAEERPAARTMALFAKQNHLGKTFVERVDLTTFCPSICARRSWPASTTRRMKRPPTSPISRRAWSRCWKRPSARARWRFSTRSASSPASGGWSR